MKTFFKKVDRRSRQEMTDFLTNHFRYHTLHSWNCSTSYANCVKINRLDLSSAQLHTAWDLLSVNHLYHPFTMLFNAWASQRQWRWQIGFNGRSHGYLVLYQGGLNYKNAHTAQCDFCDKLTYHKQDTPCTSQGCPGTLIPLPDPVPTPYLYPGRSLDQGENFATWTIEDLHRRVQLVQEFDQTCDAAVALFVGYCDNYTVADKEILVPTTIKVLKPI